jgi:hypothetical protein
LEVVEPEQFLNNGIFSEDTFLQKAGEYDWGRYQGKKVLVRGCQSTIIPPWVYMYITGKLAGIARSVRYGNEHDNIVVFRMPR